MKVKPINLFGHIILLVGGLVMIYPLIFMVLASTFTKQEYAATVLGPFPIAIKPTFANFRIIVGAAKDHLVQIYFFNSLFRTLYSVVFASLTAFLGGFVFARLRFRGKDGLFLFMLATAMIPGVVALIPTYIEYARWPYAGGNNIFMGGKGILDSWWVYMIGGPALNIMGAFLVKQSMEKVPIELDEAAKIDGASTFRLIFQILLPLQLPILAFIAITTAQATWNDWGTPFFFTSSDKLQTLPAAITRISSIATSAGVPDYPLMITLGLGITFPMLLIFFFFQRFFVQGLANAGLKG
ncbi:carbohydrate ABC transporter permease [Cohnella nanjingensis]|uniref:Carbohydrate ABC transporter permease n=1 Tax=Cohnella nanjingensis TaxID=1387779 RepID=A0A7X0RVV8_9BACL|nr:carbohydrate ABC transporter permease [Cohnella nanjingensis]MBB6674570.1 carbohydrate ABC transporter permease [Cohnella nanjingensis]